MAGKPHHNYICPECGRDTRDALLTLLVTTYAMNADTQEIQALWWHKLCFRLRKH